MKNHCFCCFYQILWIWFRRLRGDFLPNLQTSQNLSILRSLESVVLTTVETLRRLRKVPKLELFVVFSGKNDKISITNRDFCKNWALSIFIARYSRTVPGMKSQNSVFQNFTIVLKSWVKNLSKDASSSSKIFTKIEDFCKFVDFDKSRFCPKNVEISTKVEISSTSA